MPRRKSHNFQIGLELFLGMWRRMDVSRDVTIMQRLISSLAIMATLVVSLPPAWCCMVKPVQGTCCANTGRSCCGDEIPADCANCSPVPGGQTPAKTPFSCIVCQSHNDIVPQPQTWEPVQLAPVGFLSFEGLFTNSFSKITYANLSRFDSGPPLWLAYCCFRC